MPPMRDVIVASRREESDPRPMAIYRGGPGGTCDSGASFLWGSLSLGLALFLAIAGNVDDRPIVRVLVGKLVPHPFLFGAALSRALQSRFSMLQLIS